MTEAERLAERLRELLAKATDGEWLFDGPPDNHIIWSSPEDRVCFMAHSNGIDPERDTARAALIVEAVNALPTLLARIAAMKSAIQHVLDMDEDYGGIGFDRTRDLLSKALGKGSE